ncbi:unnamed protein product, partial [Hapterophycus canaliculatus]
QAASAYGQAGEVFDFIYGLHPNSPTGGCVVQRSFEDDLRGTAGVGAVNVHVASDRASAEGVFELLQKQKQREQERREKGREGWPSGVLIIDGIALLFLRDRLEELRRSRRVMAGFIHSPFSEPFYREEAWLTAAVPEHVLMGGHGAALHAEESRLFGLFDRIIAVGAPCRSLLTAGYGVAEDAIVVLEPTLATLPTATVTAAAVAAAVDVDVSVPPAGPAEVRGPTESPPRFVSVGTLCPRKGQLSLIASLRVACAAHPKELGGSVLTLIGGDGGDPSYVEAVRSAASAVGDCILSGADGEGNGRVGLLEVRLLGPLSHGETLENVRASDAFLLNSSLESWAIAPVEAALRGVPVLSTRVGLLTRVLPLESTIWVGSGRAEQEQETDGVTRYGTGLASSSDWEKALVRFTRARRRYKSRAECAVPDLTRRISQAAGGSRAQAVQAIMKTATERRTSTFECSTIVADDPNLSNGCAYPFEGAAAIEQERVRRATVTNALACVCATCVSISGVGGAAGGLVALVAAQCCLIFSLAPPCSPANLVTIFRSFIPPAVVWFMAGSDFVKVAMADVSLFGLLFVLLDVVDGVLARRSKTGPTRVGAALDVESDSIAVLFLSLAASRKAWSGGFIAGVLRYLFVLATGARELPPSPIGPAGRWFAKVAALASVVALAASIGNCTSTDSDPEYDGCGGSGSRGGHATSSVWQGWGEGWTQGGMDGSSPFLCAAGVAVLCASFSVDFFQIWVLLPRAAAASPDRTYESTSGGNLMANGD